MSTFTARVANSTTGSLPNAASPAWGSPAASSIAEALWPVHVPKVVVNVLERLAQRGAPVAGLREVKKLRLLDSAEIESLLQLVQSGHPAIVQAYRATLLDRSPHSLALRLAALVQVSPTPHAIAGSVSPGGVPAPRYAAPAATPPSTSAYHHAFLPGTPPPPPGIAAPYSGARSIATPSQLGYAAPPLPASPAYHTPQQQLVAVSPPSGQSIAMANAAQDMWRFISKLQQRGDISQRGLSLCHPLVQAEPRVAAAWQQLVQAVSAAESALLAQLEQSPRSAWGDAQQVRAMRRLQEHKADAENTFLWSLADTLVATHGEIVLDEFSHKALGLDGPYGAPPLPANRGGVISAHSQMPVPTPLGSPDSGASHDEDWMGASVTGQGYGGGAQRHPTSTRASNSSTGDSSWLQQVKTPPYMQAGSHFVSPSGSGGGASMPPPADEADRMHSAAGAFPHAPLAGVLHNVAAMSMPTQQQVGHFSEMLQASDPRLARAYADWEATEGDVMLLLRDLCSVVRQAMQEQHGSGTFDGVAASTPDGPVEGYRGGAPRQTGMQHPAAAPGFEHFEVVETLSGGEVAEGESDYPPPHPHGAYAAEFGAEYVDTSYASLGQNDDSSGAAREHGVRGAPPDTDAAHLGRQHAELVGRLRSAGRISGSDATALRHMWAEGEPRVRAAWLVAAQTGDSDDLTQTLLTILEQELASASATPEHVLHVVDGMADLKRISARQAEVLRSIVHLASRGDSINSDAEGGEGGVSPTVMGPQRSISAPSGGVFSFAPRARTSSFYVHTSEAQEALHTITQALASGSKGAAGEGGGSLQGVLVAVADEWISASAASTPRSSNSAAGTAVAKGSRALSDLSEASTGTATRNTDTVVRSAHFDELNVDTSPRPEHGTGAAAAVRGFSRESDLPWIEESGGGATPEALRELEACAAGEGDPRAGSREWLLIRIARLVKSGEVNDAQASVLTQLINGNDPRLWGALEAYKALCAPGADEGGGIGAVARARGACAPQRRTWMTR